jgi:hypothetical protein
MIPKPGLSGDWRSSCVVCTTATDTGMLLEGESEWLAGAVSQLGIPIERATTMVAAFFAEPGLDPPMVPPGRHEMLVRICARCAAAVGVPTAPGLIVTDEGGVGRIAGPVPRFTQPLW